MQPGPVLHFVLTLSRRRCLPTWRHVRTYVSPARGLKHTYVHASARMHTHAHAGTRVQRVALQQSGLHLRVYIYVYTCAPRRPPAPLPGIIDPPVSRTFLAERYRVLAPIRDYTRVSLRCSQVCFPSNHFPAEVPFVHGSKQLEDRLSCHSHFVTRYILFLRLFVFFFLSNYRSVNKNKWKIKTVCLYRYRLSLCSFFYHCKSRCIYIAFIIVVKFVL